MFKSVLLRRTNAASVVGAALAVAVSAAPPQNGVAGRVVDEAGKPLTGVEVVLESTGHQTMHNTTTDTEGRFQISNAEPGSYLLAASDPLRPHTHYGEIAGAGSGIELALDVSTMLGGLELGLRRGGVVSGVVLMPDGEPASSAEVAVLPVLATRVETSHRTTTTDSTGRYRVFGIPPGTYTVAARPTSRTVARVNDGIVTLVVPTLFGEATDFHSATRFDMPSGATLTSDIRFQTRQAGTVKGAIRGLEQVQPKSYRIQLLPDELAPSWWIEALASATVNGVPGDFVFEHVAPRAYRVEAKRLGAKWSPDDADLIGLARTVVAGADVSVVNVDLRRGFEVAGKVTCGPASGNDDRPNSIALVGQGLLWSVPATARLDTTGSFIVRGLIPGTYRIGVVGGRSREEWRIDRTTVAGRDSADPSISVTDSDVLGVHLDCYLGKTRLTGTVEGPDGDSLTDLAVVVQAVGQTAGGTGSVRVVRPDAKGRYAIVDVPSGDLTVGLVKIEAFLANSLEILEMLRTEGVPVHILRGEQRSLVLTIRR